MEIDPDGYNAYLELGLLFMTSERPTEALELYEARLDRGPAEGSGVTPAENRYYHATLLEHVTELVFARTINSVRAIRVQALRSGSDALTRSDIEREIKAARRALKQRARRG